MRFGRLARRAAAALAAGLFAASAPAAAATYSPRDPVVLTDRPDAAVTIDADPERTLYRRGDLPGITVRWRRMPGARLTVRVADGFGSTLSESSAAAEIAGDVPVVLPAGHGYYEVEATARRDGKAVASARRSIGALSPPADPAGDEPFGLWIQGGRNYPELGVRWTREGVWWPAYRKAGSRYLEKRAALFDNFRRQGIRVIAYPKHPHPNQVSREVIEDRAAAWEELSEWWTTMVRTLAGHVDAWAVVNEPMRGRWKGDDRLILRYWKLMRRIVDRYDPTTPLIGPSLSPNIEKQVAQYRDLLGLGFGRTVDAVEMHTYIDAPEDGWAAATRRIEDMTAEATGRVLPVWSTEHGYTADYAHELGQARLLMRSYLEAKRIGYPVVIWHMFGNPQGAKRREIEFAIFRGARDGRASPQPRPAGVAYGVMTRQLAGARFRTSVAGFGASVKAYVFDRAGEAVTALWSVDGTSKQVTLPATPRSSPTVTGLFGRRTVPPVRDGRIRIEVGGNPVFVTAIDVALLPR